MQSRPTVARPNDDVCADDACVQDECPVAGQPGTGKRDARRQKIMPPRANEQVGGGYFIFRRGTRTGRIKTGHIKHGKIPFEHPSLESAVTEATRLADLYGGKFDILSSAHQIDGGPVRRAATN